MSFIKRYSIHIVLSILAWFALDFLFSHLQADLQTIVTVAAEIPDTDSFQVFYTPEGQQSFTGETSMSIRAQGGKNAQKLVYVIPHRLNPEGGFRIDLGNELPPEADEEIIVLKSIKLSNGSTEYTIPADSMSHYFEPNIPEVPGKPGAYITGIIGNNVYDPYLSGKGLSSIISGLNHPVSAVPFPTVLFLCFWMTGVFFIFHLLPPLSETSDSIKVATVTVFVVMLCIPLAVRFLPGNDTEVNAEKRALAERPSFEFTKRFARKFDAYYGDTFGFRSWLIRTGSHLKMMLFNTSINPERALIGKEGYLYYNDFGGSDKNFASYTHTNLLTKKQLALYADMQERIYKTCLDSGVIYILGFWPEKATVYPEYLPKVMRMQIKDTLSRADQIIGYLKERNSPVKFIDVRPALAKTKQTYPVFYRHDTHWNNYGAYTGYKSLFEQSYDKLGIKPYQESDFTMVWRESSDGDLLDMIGVGTTSGITESVPDLIFNTSLPYTITSSSYFSDRTLISNCEQCSDKRKVVVFRDSYTTALIQYYSLHFKEVIYIWAPYQQSVVNELKPDIVFSMSVERFL